MGSTADGTASISVLQHVNLSQQIRPWDTLACCWDVKQPTKQQTNLKQRVQSQVVLVLRYPRQEDIVQVMVLVTVLQGQVEQGQLSHVHPAQNTPWQLQNSHNWLPLWYRPSLSLFPCYVIDWNCIALIILPLSSFSCYVIDWNCIALIIPQLYYCKD